MAISNFNKIVLIALSLAALMFVACGDDDSTTIRYQKSTTDSVNIYVYIGKPDRPGQPERIKVDSLRRRSIEPYVSSMYETYRDATMTFEEDMLLLKQGTSASERRSYKFEGNSLMILSGETWTYMGTGSKKEVNVRQYYIATIINNQLTKIAAPPVRDLTIEDAAKLTSLGSLQNLNLKTDTIILCTRESLFQ